MLNVALPKRLMNQSVQTRSAKRRPCTFGQSLWYTNCPVNFTFFGILNIFLVDQIFFSVNQISFWYTKIFFGRQKKLEIERTIGIPKRLTKSTWTPLLCTVIRVHISSDTAFFKILKKPSIVQK